MTNYSQFSVITGGSSGLGKAFASALLKEKYDVAIIARDALKLNATAKEIEGESQGKLSIFPADISSIKDMETTARLISEQGKPIHFLILNAGIVQVKLLKEYSDFSELKKVIDINLWGTILSARCFIPLMPKGGRILLISSGFGLMGVAGYSTYCASKAGIINFAEALRRELLSQKISVYVACPADIDTPQYQDECANMPDWMCRTNARGKTISAELAAKLILNKCHGNHFRIDTSSEVKLFSLCNKILPYRVVRFLLDKVFPIPT